MNNKVKDILEQRKVVLMEHIRLDKNCLNDPFLSQFMEGRVEQEESWLDETEKLAKVIDPKEMFGILMNRKAILKSFIADARANFRGTEGQTMRGRTAVNTHWLEETETLLNCTNKEII